MFISATNVYFLFDRINMKCLLMSVANRAVHVQFRAWWMVEAWCRDRTSHRWLALHCIPLFIAYQIQVSRKSCLYMVLDSFSTVCHLIAINNIANVHEVWQTRYRREYVGIAGQRRRFSFSSWLRGLKSIVSYSTASEELLRENEFDVFPADCGVNFKAEF